MAASAADIEEFLTGPLVTWVSLPSFAVAKQSFHLKIAAIHLCEETRNASCI